jgi:hypothetical protein
MQKVVGSNPIIRFWESSTFSSKKESVDSGTEIPPSLSLD